MTDVTKSTMGQWKRRVIEKKSRGRQESGRSKGLVPPVWARNCARAARAYKNNDMYTRWSELCNGDKVKWTKT